MNPVDQRRNLTLFTGTTGRTLQVPSGGRAMFLSRLLDRTKPRYLNSNYLRSPVRSPELKEEQGFESSEGTSQRGFARIICAQRNAAASVLSQKYVA
jgi:hypothetical protein